MKTLIKMIVCCAALLPLSQAQAGTRYYGLAPGKIFTLQVTNVVATKASLTYSGKSKIPSGIPKFSKGQKVTLKIGSNGELKGPDFATKFKSATASDNIYTDDLRGSNLPDTAVVRKNQRLKPIFTELVFFKTTGVGTLSQATYMVVYTLEN